MKWIKRNESKTLKDYFLNNMKVSSLTEINAWFTKYYENAYRIDNLTEAVKLAKKFKNRRVTIIGDYDVDGTCATAILVQGLKEFGFKKVNYRIPKRFSEGFGINESIIDEIPNGLIITCDNGIAGIEAIKRAKEKGLTVIITDHHEPCVIDGKVTLPDADLIIDPNAIEGSADFTKYCGAGLAYRFICELFNNDKDIKVKYLPYAALATVCDVVELREENYVFVRRGLKAISHPKYCPMGIQALLKAFKFEEGNQVTETDLSFKLGPAFNSASRLVDDGANKTIELLCTTDSATAITLADELFTSNQERKNIEKDLTQKAIEIITTEGYETLNPILVPIENAHEGVIGIVASTISEMFCVPTFIFSKLPDGTLKGSARSYGNYDIKVELDKCQSLLLKYGGHSSAAGLSLKEENFFDLLETLNNNNTEYEVQDKETLHYDVEIDSSEIPEVIKELNMYAPYGEANPLPLFLVKNFTPICKFGEYCKLMGKDNNVIKIHGKDAEAVSYSLDDTKFIKNIDSKPMTLIGYLGVNTFKGVSTCQVRFKDYKVS